MYSMSEGGQCVEAKQNRANRGKAEGGRGRAPRLAGSPRGVRAGLGGRLANEATWPEKAGGGAGRVEKRKKKVSGRGDSGPGP